MIDNDRLQRIKDSVLEGNYSQMGIGTLKEKTVHLVMA